MPATGPQALFNITDGLVGVELVAFAVLAFRPAWALRLPRPLPIGVAVAVWGMTLACVLVGYPGGLYSVIAAVWSIGAGYCLTRLPALLRRHAARWHAR